MQFTRRPKVTFEISVAEFGHALGKKSEREILDFVKAFCKGLRQSGLPDKQLRRGLRAIADGLPADDRGLIAALGGRYVANEEDGGK